MNGTTTSESLDTVTDQPGSTDRPGMVDQRGITDQPGMVDRETAAEWATWFAAIGDPTRILILHLLAREDRAMTVGEITERLDVGQSTVSHHLAKLGEVCFLLVERIGTTSHWRINQNCLSRFPSAAEMIMGRVDRRFTEAMEVTR